MDSMPDCQNVFKEVLHRCKFCDQCFLNFDHYNYHLITEHLKPCLTSVNYSSVEKICSEIAENKYNPSQQSSLGSNLAFYEKPLTGHLNEHQARKSSDFNLPSVKFNSKDCNSNINGLQNSQLYHNTYVQQLDDDMKARFNSGQSAYLCDTLNSSFCEHNNIEIAKSMDKNDQLLIQRNKFVNQILSSAVKDSCSNLIGESAELEVKICFRPKKDKNLSDNIVSDKCPVKETILPNTRRSTDVGPFSGYVWDHGSHPERKGYFSQNSDINEQIALEPRVINRLSHHKGMCSYINVSSSPLSVERSVLNSAQNNDNLERINIYGHANKRKADLTNSFPIRDKENQKKIPKLSLIGDNIVNEDRCTIIIQYSCNACKNVFSEKAKFEAHHCTYTKDASRERLTENIQPEKMINNRRNLQNRSITTEYSQSSDRTDSENVQNLQVTKEITIDDPVIKLIYQDIKIDDSDIELEDPDIKVDNPHIKFRDPDIKIGDSDIELNEPDVKIDDSDIELNEPDVKIDDSDIELNEPDVKIDDSDIELNEPDIKIDDSDIELNEPDVKIDDSDIELHDTDIKVDDPDIYIIEDLYSCDICKKVFSQQNELDWHSCIQNKKQILSKKESNHHLTHLKSYSSSGYELHNTEFTARNTPKNAESVDNDLFIIEEVSSDSDIIMTEVHYLCIICEKNFSARNELDSHVCTRTQEHFSVDVDSNAQSSSNVESRVSADVETNAQPSSNVESRVSANVDTNAQPSSNVESRVSADVDTNAQPSSSAERRVSADMDSNTQSSSIMESTVSVESNEDSPMPCFPKNVKEISPNPVDTPEVAYPHYCDGCNVGFYRQLDLYVHFNTCDSRNIIKDKTNSSISGKDDDTHFSNQQNQTSIKNIYKASLRINSKNNMSKTYYTYTCQVCNREFSEKRERDLHSYIHLENNELACIFCDKKFSVYGELMEHFTLHNDKTLHFCFYCSKSFVQEKDLKRHKKKTHKNRLAYSCNVCKRKFEFKLSLRSHICMSVNSKNNDKSCFPRHRNTCKHCDKTFPSKVQLKRHLVVHEKDTCLFCHICPLSFTNTKALQNHLMRHANIRPHLCLICYTGYFSQWEFLEHLNIHAGKGPSRQRARFANQGKNNKVS